MKDIHFGRDYGALYRRTNTFMKEAFKQLDFTFFEGIVLVFICENPGVIQDKIAYVLAVDKAVVTRSVKNLEKLLFIERKEDINNGRVKKVYPTAKANTSKIHIDEILNYWNSIILADYTESEQAHLMSAFTKMRTRAISVDIETELAKIDFFK